MRIFALIFGALILFTAPAVAQMGMGGGGRGGGMGMGPGITGTMLPRIDGETLIQTPIGGWDAAPPAQTDNKVEVFMFPRGEDSSNWTEAYQREAFHSTAGMESAMRVYELRSQGDQQNCPNYESDVREDEPDNGYSSIMWRQSCERAPGQVFTSLHKVILGNDRLYILTKIWREEPSGRAWRQWEGTFEETYVCDPNRREAHPCRPPQ